MTTTTAAAKARAARIPIAARGGFALMVTVNELIPKEGTLERVDEWMNFTLNSCVSNTSNTYEGCKFDRFHYRHAW